MPRREFSILPTSSAQSIADKAALARELFSEFGTTTLHDETTTTPEPARSFKTTTVERRTGLVTRAIALSTLAEENLAFFRERNLAAPEAMQPAETAIGGLHDFLQRNRNNFTKEVSRDVAFVQGALRSVEEELATAQKEFRSTKDEQERATIEGQINLANLRIARLRRLSNDGERALRLFAQLGSRSSRKR